MNWRLQIEGWALHVAQWLFIPHSTFRIRHSWGTLVLSYVFAFHSAFPNPHSALGKDLAH